MRRLPYPLVLVALTQFATPPFASAAYAQNEVYKCVDAAGRPRYTNIRKDALARSCKRVTREVSVVPTSAIPALPASPNSAASAGKNSPKPGAADAAAASFPRVDTKTQKSRDQERRQILQDELAGEEKSLTAARTRLADAQTRTPDGSGASIDRLLTYREAVERHERNIGALKRELADLK